MKAANDNFVRSATTGKVLDVAGMVREGAHQRQKRGQEEAKAMKIETRRIGQRAKKGADWDGAANDNVHLPAIKWLIQTGRKEMLKPLLDFIRLDRQAYSGALLTGDTGNAQDLLQVQLGIDHKVWIDPKTGALKYKGERRMTGIEFTGREHPGKSDADPLQVKKEAAPVAKPWSGDMAVIERIDAVPVLSRIRAGLGPLLIPFERLALEGQTLEKVGLDCFATNERAAMSIGGAVLMLGLGVVMEVVGHDRRRAA